MNHEFIFKFLTMPPINSELRRAISKVNAKWSGLTLQSAGDYELVCDLHLALVNAIGIANVEVTSIRVIPDCDTEEVAPRAIGLNDLPLREKAAIAFEILKKRVATKLLAEAYICSTKEAVAKVRDFGEMDLDMLSEQDIHEMIAKFCENLKETDYTEEAGISD